MLTISLIIIWITIPRMIVLAQEQKRIESIFPTDTINLSLPLKVCFRYNPTNNLIGYASDNIENLFTAYENGKIEKINIAKNNTV